MKFNIFPVEYGMEVYNIVLLVFRLKIKSQLAKIANIQIFLKNKKWQIKVSIT